MSQQKGVSLRSRHPPPVLQKGMLFLASAQHHIGSLSLSLSSGEKSGPKVNLTLIHCAARSVKPISLNGHNCKGGGGRLTQNAAVYPAYRPVVRQRSFEPGSTPRTQIIIIGNDRSTNGHSESWKTNFSKLIRISVPSMCGRQITFMVSTKVCSVKEFWNTPEIIDVKTCVQNTNEHCRSAVHHGRHAPLLPSLKWLHCGLPPVPQWSCTLLRLCNLSFHV
jgi:hypothetical protein